ncbi:MAG TPA: YIP1 family protein [Pyrinomonadaceae bacterium]
MTSNTKRFVVPAVVFGAGILLIVATILKVGVGFGPAAALCVLGLALFGLSFIPHARAVEDPPAPMPFFEKLGNIFFEPSAVFRNLRAHPRWLVALILAALLSFAYTTAFTRRLTPERIVSFTLDKVAEKFNIPPEQAARMKEQQIADAKAPEKIAGNAVTTFVFMFFVMCLLAGLYMLFVLLFGGRLSFWPAVSMAVWAALPPVLIGKVLSLVLLYVKDPDDIHPLLGQNTLVTDNLGALVKPADSPVLFAVLSAFGVLAFYHLWLTATGLRNTSDRLSKGSAWTIAIIFWGIGLLLGVVSSALFGSFIS